MVTEGELWGRGARTMAESVTYADLRFVKAPLKKRVSSQPGQGKGRGRVSWILHPQPLS